MIKKELTIVNPAGIQVEAAGVFCDVAMGYKCHIEFNYRGGSKANAKSILSLLGAGIRKGEVIELCCDGPDEEEAINELEQLINNRFKR